MNAGTKISNLSKVKEMIGSLLQETESLQNITFTKSQHRDITAFILGNIRVQHYLHNPNKAVLIQEEMLLKNKDKREKLIKELRGKYLSILPEAIRNQILYKSRKSNIVPFRYSICYKMFLDGISQYKIALTLDIDHTTVGYAISKLPEYLKQKHNVEFIKIWHEYENLLKQSQRSENE
jgi:hypothetical protein